jgi:hypothetical protein
MQFREKRLAVEIVVSPARELIYGRSRDRKMSRVPHLLSHNKLRLRVCGSDTDKVPPDRKKET